MLQINHGSKRPRSKSTKLTSQIHRFRPRSRKNEISDISLGRKCVVHMEMSNSRISCTWNGARRSSIYNSPAAWAKDLSFEACFRSIVSFGDPHYLSRTSPDSIQCAWNSRILNFDFRKTLLPLRNLWNFAPCKRFRPVQINPPFQTLRFNMYVWFIGLRLTKTSLTLISRTRLRTKGQSAGYPEAQIGITSNSFQRRAP